jgi:hypothetical protein
MSTTAIREKIRLEVNWDDVTLEALRGLRVCTLEESGDTDADYEDYLDEHKGMHYMVGRQAWSDRCAKSAHLGAWCKLPRHLRNETTALADPVKLRALRDIVSSVRNVDNWDEFGFDFHHGCGIEIRVIVGGPWEKHAIEIEAPGPGVFHVYEVYADPYDHPHLKEVVIARSEAEAEELYNLIPNTPTWEDVGDPYVVEVTSPEDLAEETRARLHKHASHRAGGAL